VTVNVVSDSARGVTQTITIFVETRSGAVLTATRDVTMAHALAAVGIPSPLNAGDVVTGSVVPAARLRRGRLSTHEPNRRRSVPATCRSRRADRADFQVTATVSRAAR
jgi:hypothetical protein